MAVIRRFHWKVNKGSNDEFIELHREFEDNYREKAGGTKMDLHEKVNGPFWVYLADVYFEDWSGMNSWNDFFETEAGRDFGSKITATAECIDDEFFLTIDY